MLKKNAKQVSAAIGFFLSFMAIAAYSQNPRDSLGCDYLKDIFSKISDPQAATAIYYQSLKNLEKPSPKNDDRLKMLETDIIDIITDEERRSYKNLKSSAEKVAFFERFWLIRDLTPATETNERLVEHYVRLAYARDRYKFFDARGYDDRGQIHVQYWPPTDFAIIDMDPSTVPTEAWSYHNLGAAPATFDFIDNGYGYRLAWRFDAGIKVVSPGARFGAIGRRLKDKLAFLSPEYGLLFVQYESISSERGSVLEKLRKMEIAIAQHAVKTEVLQARLPKAVSDILEDISILPFASNLARFKENAHHQSLAIAYGFKAHDLKFAKEDYISNLLLAAAVKDTNRLTLADCQDTLHLASSSFNDAGEFVGALQYKISPGRYFVALDLNNPAKNQRGLKDFSIMVGHYPTGRLHLSSVIFAKEVRPKLQMASAERQPIMTSFFRHNLEIKPYPFSILKHNTPIFVYFEIYDLKRGGAGETFYTVEYEVSAPSKKGLAWLLAGLNPFSKSGGSISVSETRRGNSEVEPTYLQLDFSQLRGGKYNLIVRVTDKLAKLTKEKSWNLSWNKK